MFDKYKFDWDKLKYFLTIVENRSINKAAQGSGRKQSSISRQMTSLEDQLGVPLIRRHARGIDLTEQGEELIELAKEIAEKIYRKQTIITENHKKPEGLIRLGVSPCFGDMWMSSNMDEFYMKYPNITMKIHVSENKNLESFFRDVDCMVLLGQPKRLDTVIKKLFSNKYIICTTQKYIDRFGKPESLGDLDHHQLIVYTDLLLKLGCPPGISRKPAIQVNSIQSMLNYVLSGLGIAILPRYIAHHPQLIHILKEAAAPDRECYFCYPSELKNSKRLHVLRDYLLEKTAIFREDS